MSAAAPAPVSTLRSVAQQVVQTSAVALFAKPSADYADKLAQAQDCLRQAAALGAVYGGATVCAAAEAVDRARTRNVRRESIDMTVSLAHGA